MSWSDIFYPGNPGRRQEVIRLFTKLITLMESNFKRTNDLIDILHEHLPGKTFRKISVDHDATIKVNCDRIVERITEIQAYIVNRKDKLKQLLDPTIYTKIMDTKVTFAQKLELGRKITGVTLMSIGTITGITVCALISRGKFLVTMAEKMTKVGACAAAGVAVAVVFLAIDMIASAIIGAVERGKLEQSIKDLEVALVEFEPASYDYTKRIEKVICLIEISAEKA